jgi:opacity protein-like surface antigen
MRTKIKLILAAACGVLALMGAQTAGAAVLNGSFEVNGGNGQLGVNTSATDWSVPSVSYTFLFGPGTADTTGATGQYGSLGLWGPGNGVNNNLPATSPDGGYYIAQDSAFQQGALTQTISGLTPGHQYNVGFWWAAAQQQNFRGATYSEWNVSLGGSPVQSTGYANIADQGFSGWQYQSFTFTADATSDVLSFLANGGPTVPSLPPFALLDGVSLTASSPVPEPSTAVAGSLVLLPVGASLLRRLASRRPKA